jgi:hypothetical protein
MSSSAELNSAARDGGSYNALNIFAKNFPESRLSFAQKRLW